jgi:hypothetical protein
MAAARDRCRGAADMHATAAAAAREKCRLVPTATNDASSRRREGCTRRGRCRRGDRPTSAAFATRAAARSGSAVD